MSEEEQLVGTLIKIESHRQVEFIPNEYSRHVIDSEGLPVYAEPQPQLTIPKSIAEQADKTDLDTLFKWGQQEFYQWFNHEQDEYMPVIYAYLAGKALGVDLVKVVEG